MPWALAGDDDFFPDDLDYSDELTQKWDWKYDSWKPKDPLPAGSKWNTIDNDRQTRVWGEATGTGGWVEEGLIEGEEDADRVEETDVDDYDWDYESNPEQDDDPGVSLGDIMDDEYQGDDDDSLDWGFQDDYDPNQAYENLEPAEPEPDTEEEPEDEQPEDEQPEDEQPEDEQPEDEQPEPEPEPTTEPHPKKPTPHLSQFGQYLISEHMDVAQQLASGAIDVNDVLKLLPMTAEGELALGGDDVLEEQLGLPDEVRAVQVGSQVITQYDPSQVQLHNSSHTII
jgi:hypothetical protein